MKNKRINMKEAGITLVALVVTIIVLLILAGVTITMTLSGSGILNRATSTRDTQEKAKIQEEIQLAWNAVQVDGITKGWTLDKKATELKNELDKENSTNSSTVTKQSDDKSLKVTYKGYETTINTETGSMTALAKINSSSQDNSSSNNNNNSSIGLRASITPAPTGTTYTAGQEVTLGNEQFFVLSDTGTELKLLAKYCLNKAGTTQINAEYGTYGRSFSKTQYWLEADWGNDYYCDLQSTAMISAATADGDVADGIPNAVKAAMAYGVAKGVTGRLMTYAEAVEIAEGSDQTMRKILYGNWKEEDESTLGLRPTEHFLYFWLGTGDIEGDLYWVYGSHGSCVPGGYLADEVGVRPVLEVY